MTSKVPAKYFMKQTRRQNEPVQKPKNWQTCPANVRKINSQRKTFAKTKIKKYFIKK